MQVSINASEVLLREPVRMDLERKVKEFLKQKSVNEVEQGLGSKENKFLFNDSISLAPTRRTAAAAEKEALHAAIAELSHIEIAGVTLIRSAYEVSALLRKRGFNLLSPSVRRVAAGIGIVLAK
jgi:hypothetical protein